MIDKQLRGEEVGCVWTREAGSKGLATASVQINQGWSLKWKICKVGKYRLGSEQELSTASR
jgi:hypothetical protein